MDRTITVIFATARRCCTSLLILILTCAAGCSQGIHWHGFTFEPVHNDAKRNDKLTFVYLRHWSSIECTNFEEDILKSAPVLEALRPSGPFYCAVLDAYTDRAMARDWGIDKIPGVVVLDPKSRVTARLMGNITADQLLTALHDAVNAYPAASQPHRSP